MSMVSSFVLKIKKIVVFSVNFLTGIIPICSDQRQEWILE